ncbi:MAG: hypothetical protein JW795_17160 [Chitinivibrionales bacterium]|nr:hypothetical protein [Chitinivibrionales bacterium]
MKKQTHAHKSQESFSDESVPQKNKLIQIRRLRHLSSQQVHQDVAQLCTAGETLEGIVNRLNITFKQAAASIERLVRLGAIDESALTKYVSVEKQREIIDAFQVLQTSSITAVLRTIQENGSRDILEHEVRIVRGLLVRRRRETARFTEEF